MIMFTKCVAFLCAISLFIGGCSTDPVNPDGTVGIFNIDNAAAGDLVPDQYIVVLKQQSGIQSAMTNVDETVRELTTANNIPSANVLFVYKAALNGFAVNMSSEQASAIRKDGRVEFVEQDKVVRLDPITVSKKSETTQAQQESWGCQRVGGPGNGTGNYVWVIDTGVDLKHDDLFIDKVRAATFVKQGADANSATDLHGHGTHVAGIIAAKNNNKFTVGVAAGAVVVPVKVLNKNGVGTTAMVVAGINWVAYKAQKGDVANMSLGGTASKAMDNAVKGAASSGVVMVLAAGNSADDAGDYSPARANGANIYTVSSMGGKDYFSWFSNYGNPPVDYCAPGEQITSLLPGNNTATWSGTSMAAPHVAGILVMGNINTDGYAYGDPDGDDDPIAHR